MCQLQRRRHALRALPPPLPLQAAKRRLYYIYLQRGQAAGDPAAAVSLTPGLKGERGPGQGPGSRDRCCKMVLWDCQRGVAWRSTS